MSEERGLTNRILSTAQRLEGGTASSLPYSPPRQTLSDPARPAVQPDPGVMREMTPRMKAEQYGPTSLSGIGYAFNQVFNALPAGLEALANLTNVERARSEGMAANVAAAREVGERFYEDPGSVDMVSYAREVNAPFPAVTGTLADVAIPGPGELVAGAKAVGAGVGAALAAGGEAVVDAARGLADFAAIPFLRFTRRSLPEAAEVIDQAKLLRERNLLPSYEAARETIDYLSRTVNPDNASGINVRMLDSNDFDDPDNYRFAVTDDRTGVEIVVSADRAYDPNLVDPDATSIWYVQQLRPFAGRPGETIPDFERDMARALDPRSDIASGANLSFPAISLIADAADASGTRVYYVISERSPYDNLSGSPQEGYLPDEQLAAMLNRFGFVEMSTETGDSTILVRDPLPFSDVERAEEISFRIDPLRQIDRRSQNVSPQNNDYTEVRAIDEAEYGTDVVDDMIDYTNEIESILSEPINREYLRRITRRKTNPDTNAIRESAQETMNTLRDWQELGYIPGDITTDEKLMLMNVARNLASDIRIGSQIEQLSGGRIARTALDFYRRSKTQ